MEPLISVIVPVYNGEKYIARCILSILNQTYQNKEIIIVDDGSNDQTNLICQKLKIDYKEIKIYKKENRGAASARNYGIDISRGECLVFVDADDFIYPKYIEYLYYLMKKYKSDISVCSCYKVAEHEKLPKFKNDSVEILYNREEALESLLYRKEIAGYPVAKLYSRDVVQELYFPEHIKYGEDLFFSINVFAKSHRIVWGSEILYLYYQNESSITHNMNIKECIEAWKIFKENLQLFEKSFPNLKGAVNAKLFILSIDYCCRIKGDIGDKKFEKILFKYMNENCKNIWRDKRCKKSNRILALSCIINSKITVRFCILYLRFIKLFRIAVRKSV